MTENNWCHLGGGKIYEKGGLYVGQFFGDFRRRDQLILAVNSEETLRARIAELEAQLRTEKRVSSEYEKNQPIVLALNAKMAEHIAELELIIATDTGTESAVAKLQDKVAELEKEASWIRGKLKLPEDTKLLSGEVTLAGTMHCLVSHANGYLKYIETEKCDDKAGEIARQSVRIAELEKQRDGLAKDAERYRFLRDDSIPMPDGQRDIGAVRFRESFAEDQSDETLFGDDLDAAIDAALASAQKGGV